MAQVLRVKEIMEVVVQIEIVIVLVLVDQEEEQVQQDLDRILKVVMVYKMLSVTAQMFFMLAEVVEVEV